MYFWLVLFFQAKSASGIGAIEEYKRKNLSELH